MIEKRTPIVAFYGKVRIPTIGHKKAIDTAKNIAKRVNGRLVIGLSGTSKPLSSETKKAHAEMLFKHPVQTGDEHTKNLFAFLTHLNQSYNELHLIAGSDRASEYKKTLQQWNNKADRSGKTMFNFKTWKVHEVEGTRADVNKHPTKMSKDELEKSVSATRLETLAKDGDFEGFKAYHPGFPTKHVEKVYNQIRMSSPATAPKSVKKLREDFTESDDLDHKKFGPMLDSFVKFASKRLGLKSLPSMRLEKEPMSSSFGGYNPADKSIVVITKNRHPMDIYRTVAHELVHHKQNEDGRIGKDIAKEGSTGSDIENEANAEAGKVMRWFAKSNPDMFGSKYVVESFTLEEGVNDPGLFKAVFLAGGPGSGKDYVMKQTIQGAAGWNGLQEINSDVALEFLMDREGLDKMMPASETQQRDLVRGRAKNITKERERLSLTGRRGVIINGTADDPEKIMKIKKELESYGYDTMMVFVDTKNEVSRQRNFQRGLEGGRKVPDGRDKLGREDGSPDIRLEKWIAARKAQKELKTLFGKDNFIVVDNSEDLRVADQATKERVQNVFKNTFKKVSQFVSSPVNNSTARDWIKDELAKRNITKYQPSVKSYGSHSSTQQKQSLKTNLTYYGFGRYGRLVNGKPTVTHKNKNGQLVPVQRKMVAEEGSLSLKNWFDKSKSKDGKKGWVQVGGRHDGKPCARQEGQTTTPKCRSSEEASRMSKKQKEYAFKKKQREDPNQPEKTGSSKPTMVKTYKNQNENLELQEKKDACYHKVKSRYKVWPSAYASGALVKCRQKGSSNWGNKSKKVDEGFESLIENIDKKKKFKRITKEATTSQALPKSDGVGPTATQYRPISVGGYGLNESVTKWMQNEKTIARYVERYGDLAEEKLLDTAQKLNQMNFAHNDKKFFTHMREAWDSRYGQRDMGTVSSTGKEDHIGEDTPAWSRKEGKNPEGGLNRKGIASYRRANPGSKLSLAVTTPPAKLKKGSKKAKRRLSFCRRMKGMKSKLTSAKTARDPDSRINKSLRKWNCEE
jgi:hypothetical protein